MIPYGRQSIDDTDVEAVADVLRGDWLTGGPHVEAFENELATRVGASHAIAFANGTAALHGACFAAGIGPGDRVATSTLSFVASANCARFVGADVLLLDIDPATLNFDPAALDANIDALVAVHYSGLPVDLAALRRRPRVVIEDAAHAIGAVTPWGPVGNCARSDMCCFSFHPVKTITTGEGGAVTTNDDDLAVRLREFRNHGMKRRPDLGGWYYEIEELAFNYRLTDIQAALGRSQLSKLDRFLVARERLAERYDRRLSELPLELPPATPSNTVHGRHLYPVRVPDRARVYAELKQQGIGVQVHYVPIHRHPLYAKAGFTSADFPAAEAAYAGLLSLPLHPGLDDADQDRVIDVLAKSLVS